MKVNTGIFYDRITVLYPAIDIFLTPQKKEFFKIIDGYPSGRLLEIGVGNGSHLKFYHSHRITGIDNSRAMLAQARKRTTRNIDLLQMDAEALSFPDETFDYVVMSHVIAVVADPERLLHEVHRVLKPDGKIFILNHFTPNNWLKFMDKAFQQIGSILHLKSVFRIGSIKAIDMFRLLKESPTGPFSYFKILIYEKGN